MNETAPKAVRFSYEPHPNVGYVVYADDVHVGSVQKQDDGTWNARANYRDTPTFWPTRKAASAELLRVNG